MTFSVTHPRNKGVITVYSGGFSSEQLPLSFVLFTVWDCVFIMFDLRLLAFSSIRDLCVISFIYSLSCFWYPAFGALSSLCLN